MKSRVLWMTVVVAATVGTLAGPALAKRDKPLVAQMRRDRVAVVPPRSVFITGEAKAATRHNPLQGYDAFDYSRVFVEMAVDSLHRGPTRWDALAVIPSGTFYEEIETSDPDGEPAEPLSHVPAEAAECEYLAVFRYAEFAYSVEQKPIWTRNGIYMHNLVVLELDLQMVVYDGQTGVPLGTFDALYGAEVPEIQAKPIQAKAFYRATSGALRRMRKVVGKGGAAGIDD